MVEFSKGFEKIDRIENLRKKQKEIEKELEKIKKKQDELKETEKEIKDLEDQRINEIVRERTEEEIKLIEEMEKERKRILEELTRIEGGENLEEAVEQEHVDPAPPEVPSPPSGPEKIYEGTTESSNLPEDAYKLVQLTYKSDWTDKDREDYKEIKDTLDSGLETGIRSSTDEALDEIDMTRRVLKGMGYKREKLGFADYNA